MDKVTLAEHLLTPITGAQRANEVVGDLLEQAPATPSFWLSIVRIALAYTWRWLVGIPAAMVSIAVVGVPYVTILKPQVALVVSHGQDLEHDRLIKISAYVLVAAVASVSVAGLSLVRYGWRSRVTQMSAAITVSLALSAFALCAHLSSVGFGMLSVAVLVATITALRHARLSAAVVGVTTAFGGLLFVWSFGLSLGIGLTIKWFGTASAIPPALSFLLWIALYLSEAFILSRTVRWLLADRSPVIN